MTDPRPPILDPSAATPGTPPLPTGPAPYLSSSPTPSALSPALSQLLDGLNLPQRAAVESVDGPVLVLAGPGSGKTRVLTHRIAYLVGAVGVAPWQILAVTFTNKAARVMGERLESLIGKPALQQLTLGTFHAITARMLRREAGTAGLGFDGNFVIYDTDDQLKLIRGALADLNLDDKTYRPQAVLGAISNAKNELLRPDGFAAPTYWYEVAGRVYRRYQSALRAANALDFDDLLLETALLLRDNSEVRERYQARYRYLLVDEFQDTNTAQYVFLKTMAGADEPDRPHNIFVVGDEDQSIYRWRGADYRNIARFRRDFPNSQTILLEQNYRSSQTILDAARSVIQANPHRTHKALWTESGSGHRLTRFEAYDESEEAAYVVRTIEDLVTRGTRYREIAIMYRTNAQSRVLEDTLVRRRLPYQLVGATRFYERREVKDVLAYLRFIYNPRDEVALDRIINVPPRNVGPKAWETLRNWGDLLGVPLWQALESMVGRTPEGQSEEHTREQSSGTVRAFTVEEATALGLPLPDTRTRNALGSFYDIMAELRGARLSLAVTDLLDLTLNLTGYTRWLRDGTDEGEERWENVQELRGVAVDFGTLEPEEGLGAMLEAVALVSETDALNQSADHITLLTLHAAKGLEFPVVFITGLEEGGLPHSRSFDEPEGMEEERRLFYVGLTRAEKKLYLVHAYRRTIFGSTEPRAPSRFLDDIPAETIEDKGRSTGGARPGSGARARATNWSSGGGWADGGAGRSGAQGLGGSTGRAGTQGQSGSPGVGGSSGRAGSQGLAGSPVRIGAPGQAGSSGRAVSGTGVGDGPSSTTTTFRPGDRVLHATFGTGIVVSAVPRDGDEEVTVAFAGIGVKKLFQSFAKLQRAK